MISTVINIVMWTMNAIAAPNATAQFTPCVWPNPCSSIRQVAQFKPCVWPNTCAQAPAVAGVQPCVWPNTCLKAPAAMAQFTPCVWPNPCSSPTIMAPCPDGRVCSSARPA